jgi:GH24 family phage-related lysozyme (muramidase)
MDDARLVKILGDLAQWEGRTAYLYLDGAGHVTVGVGCLLRTVEAAQALPFVNVGWLRLATREEIAADFARVLAMPAGKLAHEYRAVPPAHQIELKPDDVTALGVARLRRAVSGLRDAFVGFDLYPQPAQAALIDLAWNLGMAGLRKFRLLAEACRAGDWERASRECLVSTSRYARNAWRTQQFLLASVVA